MLLFCTHLRLFSRRSFLHQGTLLHGGLFYHEMTLLHGLTLARRVTFARDTFFHGVTFTRRVTIHEKTFLHRVTFARMVFFRRGDTFLLRHFCTLKLLNGVTSCTMLYLYSDIFAKRHFWTGLYFYKKNYALQKF